MKNRKLKERGGGAGAAQPRLKLEGKGGILLGAPPPSSCLLSETRSSGKEDSRSHGGEEGNEREHNLNYNETNPPAPDEGKFRLSRKSVFGKNSFRISDNRRKREGGGGTRTEAEGGKN